MAWTAPRTWVTGELVTASIMNTHVRDNLNVVGQVLICSQVLSGTQASFDTNTILGGNIPSTFNNLRVVWTGRSDTAAQNTSVRLRLNNDSGGNYDSQRGENSAATTWTAAQTLAATSGLVGYMTAASATAGMAGSGEILLPAYSRSTFEKLWTSAAINRDGGASTLNQAIQYGRWASTAAINRVTLFPNAGNWISGSAFYLYGLI